MQSKNLFLLYSILRLLAANPPIRVLKPDVRHDIHARSASSFHLDLFKYQPFDRIPYRVFSSVKVMLNISATANDGSQYYNVYRSNNLTELLEEYAQSQRFFGFFRSVNFWHSRNLPPFDESYVGIETDKSYAIKLHINSVDFLRLIIFCLAVALFVNARRLARNTLFYYSAGCSTGLLASILILVFLVYKIMPKKSFAWTFLLGGWSFSLYMLYLIWLNIHYVFIEYQKYIAVYVVSVVLLSFSICYRLGPPRNEKSHNLTQWALQALSLICIYNACQLEEIALLCSILLICYHNCPDGTADRVTGIWRVWNPKPRRLLTEAEYIREGQIETDKALKQLRNYCNSPNCDSWRVISRVRDPRRFASFVSGQSHLSDEEFLAYDDYSFGQDLCGTEEDENDFDMDADDFEAENFNERFNQSAHSSAGTQYLSPTSNTKRGIFLQKQRATNNLRGHLLEKTAYRFPYTPTRGNEPIRRNSRDEHSSRMSHTLGRTSDVMVTLRNCERRDCDFSDDDED